MKQRQPIEPSDLWEISRKTFCAFLLSYRLSYLRVAQAAGVHVVSVYNVANGVPVLPEHEAAIREGLYRVIAERYTAFIHTTQPDFSANY